MELEMETKIRPAGKDDLDAINRIIEAAIMTWDLADRVKRLTIPTYKYNELDLQHLEIVVAERQGRILGVAAWEQANTIDAPKNKTALLLHGVYVDPEHHRQGIGHLLFAAAEQAVSKRQLDGLLVKAQKGSEPFYIAQGMSKLAVEDEKREFENRFWKAKA
jgi:predicted N-acetyltransferase YhbS